MRRSPAPADAGGAARAWTALLVLGALLALWLVHTSTVTPLRGSAASRATSVPLRVSSVRPVATVSPIRALVTTALDPSQVRGEDDYPDPTRPGFVVVRLDVEEPETLDPDMLWAAIKQDVYTVMRALYTSGRPIGRVTIGALARTPSGAVRCVLAQVGLTWDMAGQIAWDTTDPDTLWQDMQVSQVPDRQPCG